MTSFVLVPGGWLGGWSWKRVIPLLERRGHLAHSVTLTGMGDRVHLMSGEVGVETAIQDVINAVKYDELDDVVLVGHSFAGKVVAAVADRISDRVRSLLYVDAFRPEKIRTAQGAFDPSGEFGPVSSATDTIPLTDGIIDRIGPDVQVKDRLWMKSLATPWPVKLSTDPIILSERFDSLRSAYIFCRRGGDPVDEIVAGKWGKLDGPYSIINSGHWPMITDPESLATTLIGLTG